jgi:hypothetical protein
MDYPADKGKVALMFCVCPWHYLLGLVLPVCPLPPAPLLALAPSLAPLAPFLRDFLVLFLIGLAFSSSTLA